MSLKVFKKILYNDLKCKMGKEIFNESFVNKLFCLKYFFKI